MAKGINFEPFRTQGGMRNAFNVESRGYTQGDAQADPAVRLQLCSGWLAGGDNAAPVYGGLPISESVSQLKMNVAGSAIRLATTRIDGFCVFNQAYHGVITAGNSVPWYVPGGTIHYYRLGSLARIPLRISANVVALAADTGNSDKDVDQIFVWDATNLYIDLQTPGADDAPSADERPVAVIKLLGVSANNNQAIVKDGDSVQWDDAPVGLFMI